MWWRCLGDVVVVRCVGLSLLDCVPCEPQAAAHPSGPARYVRLCAIRIRTSRVVVDIGVEQVPPRRERGPTLRAGSQLGVDTRIAGMLLVMASQAPACVVTVHEPLVRAVLPRRRLYRVLLLF